jgi:outer membrane protein assembly factor BamD (BamD/ComL family)
MVESTPLNQRVGGPKAGGGWRAAGGLSARAALFVLALLPAAGCQLTSAFYDGKNWFWEKEPVVEQTLPEDQVVMRSDGLVRDQPLPVYGGDYEGAMRLWEQKDYAKAEPIFDHIADHKKNDFKTKENALYYQAECLYHMRHYPAAADHFILLLNSFPSAAHGKEVRERLFAIANYWLDETRDEMEADRDYQDGKRWMPVVSMPSVHFFDETKPDFDTEGRACKALEAVYMTDPRGKLGEKALFLLGSVKFYREHYKDADHYFYQIVEHHAGGAFAPKALQLSIICKQIATQGADYDGRRLQEARDLITKARNFYPELARGSEDFLNKQQQVIHLLQAEKDFNMAALYERTGHPGSAYFYYVIVQRRYPGTEFADKAGRRIIELRAKAEREERDAAADAPPGDRPAPPATEQGPAPRPLTPGQPVQGPPGMLPQGGLEAQRRS